jgi:hypothetical protein
VLIFRGPTRVYLRHTRAARLTLGKAWRSEGRVYRLERGTYRWYVWALQDDQRAPKPVVQAKLTI